MKSLGFLFISALFILGACNPPDSPSATANNNGYTGSSTQIDIVPNYTWPSANTELSFRIDNGSNLYTPNPANFSKNYSTDKSYFGVTALNNQITADSMFVFGFLQNNLTPGVVYDFSSSSTNPITLLINVDTVIQGTDTIVGFTNQSGGNFGPMNGKCLILQNNASFVEGKFYLDATDPNKNKTMKLREGYFKFIKP